MTPTTRDPARPVPLDTEPSARLGEVLRLLDDVAAITGVADGLFYGIEQVTGLRPGEAQVLMAIAHGARVIPDVALRTGQADAATMATVDGLIRRGLLASRPDEVGRLDVTDAGAAVLEQVEGVQVRLLDTLVEALGEVGVAGFRATLQAIASVANTVGGHTGRLS
jgi:DNA-binding MarR family transcriptional regulator